MTTIVTCPRCGLESLRWMPFRVVCRHEHHDAANCGVCIFCREGLLWPPKEPVDAA
jgi:hypothetical protein